MQEFTYEQIREKALRQGVKDNRVHIGLWANINNYLKTRRKKNGKVTTYYISFYYYKMEREKRDLIFTHNVQSATNEYEDTPKIPAKQNK